MSHNRVRPFSDGYMLVEADVYDYSGEYAITSRDFHQELRQYVTAPLIKVADERYWLHPERAVPADSVALPGNQPDDTPILLAKDKTAERLLRSGEETAPGFVE